MGNTMLHSGGTFCQSLEVTQDEVKIKELEASTKCSKKFSYSYTVLIIHAMLVDVILPITVAARMADKRPG